MCNCNNSPGEAATEGGKELRQQAGEIMACEYIVLYKNTNMYIL